MLALVLGDTSRAPKAVRDVYEQFMHVVSSLLGGAAAFDEVQVLQTWQLNSPQSRILTHLGILLQNP